MNLFFHFFLFLGRVGLGRETLKLLVWLMMIIRFHSDTIFLGLLFSPFLRILIFWYCSRWFWMHCDVNFLMSSKVGWILRLMMFSQLKNVMFRFPFFLQIISPYNLYLNPNLVVKHYQFWRLITNFLYFRKMGKFNVLSIVRRSGGVYC